MDLAKIAVEAETIFKLFLELEAFNLDFPSYDPISSEDQKEIFRISWRSVEISLLASELTEKAVKNTKKSYYKDFKELAIETTQMCQKIIEISQKYKPGEKNGG